MAETGDCVVWHSDFGSRIYSQLSISELSLIGQKGELDRARFSEESALLALQLNNINVDFQSEYKGTETGMNQSDSDLTKYSDFGVSISVDESIPDRFKREERKIRYEIEKQKYLHKEVLQVKEIAIKLANLFQIETKFRLTEKKILIQQKIEYFSILQEVSSDGFQELADAQLEKIGRVMS